MRRLLATMLLAGVLAGCAKPREETLRLDGNLLTIDNHTDEPWSHVEVWINQNFRATAPALPAHGRINATLDGFTSGFGQRFDFRRMQIHDLRVKATLPDGTIIEIAKPLSGGALADTVKGVGGKR
jgi:hypothetical protein